MANTAYADVPGAGQGATYLTFRVKDTEAVARHAAVKLHTTAGQVTKTTVANDVIAGISREKCTVAQATSPYIARVPVQIAGTAKYLAGQACTVGSFLVIDGADGKFFDCVGGADCHYMTHGWTLNDPDADDNFGIMVLALNTPYFVSAS